MIEHEYKQLPHERLDIYGLYLETASLCADIVAKAEYPIVALDHLDRAIESVGVNLMRGNGQPAGSPARSNYLDVAIGSVHECAASLDICLSRCIMDQSAYETCQQNLWRIRGMLMGLKRCRQCNSVGEGQVAYGTFRFPFATLDMYQISLNGVRQIQPLLDDFSQKTRSRRKLDTSTTGTVLNIAEGHGRETVADQNRFMKMAQEHAYQTLLMLDLMVARKEVTDSQIFESKAMHARVIAMLHAWCERNEQRNNDG